VVYMTNAPVSKVLLNIIIRRLIVELLMVHIFEATFSVESLSWKIRYYRTKVFTGRFTIL
jgi:hypothetical protein